MADKAKNLLDRIKALFDNALPTTYQLADGTEVSISLLDVGGDFSIGGVPAPEGTYSLQDGTNVVVDATGKITSVTDPSAFSGTEYTLADGTKVSIDKMEVGGKVQQGSAPIANGDYTLEDGSKITTVDGAITVVTPKAAEPAPAKMTKEQVQQAYDTITTAPAGDQTAKLVTCVKALMDYCFGWQMDDPTYNAAEEVQDAQQVADAIAAVTTLNAQFSTQNTELVKLRKETGEQKEVITKMLGLMTELAELPSADAPEGVGKKVIFSGEVQKSKKAGILKYAAAAQKLADEHKN